MAACPDLISLAGAPVPVRHAVLDLNERNVAELSELDEARLDRLVAQSFQAVVIEDGSAFLIAFDQHADYDSPNFRWFQARYPRFVYVDRVAVAANARGRGLARSLYGHLLAAARASGHRIVGCEVNVDPPNPASDAFHSALGFEEVGQALLGNGKTVRYLVNLLDSEPANG